MASLTRVLLCFLILLSLSGCGVLLPYLYDARKLDDRLTVSMPRVEVLRQLGKPDRIVQNDGQQAVWEYSLYAKGEWLGYLAHCPFHVYCYFPGEPPSPYYVALRDDHLCLWGTPDVVRILIWKVCGTGPRSKGTGELTKGGLSVSVVPVFMPPQISPHPQRLAVVSLAESPDKQVASWLDLALTFLRTRHPRLVLVEREDLKAVLEEVGIQYSGRVDDEATVRVGKLSGADSLLAYRLTLTENEALLTASFELRLLRVETGTTLFRQITTATAAASGAKVVRTGSPGTSELVRRLVVEEAAAYGLAALTAAFGDNRLGIVPDQTWPDEGVKLLGLLQGSPAAREGFKAGDRILKVNGQRIQNWTQAISLPASFTVERDNVELELTIGS